ncbi:hypothetical protein AB0A01_002343, partial [Escherichia coli]
ISKPEVIFWADIEPYICGLILCENGLHPTTVLPPAWCTLHTYLVQEISPKPTCWWAVGTQVY